MIDKIQYEKAEKKIEIIKDIINGLVDYNNLINYDNQKKFSINIDYYKDKIKDCYIYTININRGLDNPKSILNMRIQYKDKINKLILELINNLYSNKYFDYTSYKIDTNTKYNDTFYINFKNNVSVSFKINDKKDEILYESINKYYNNPIINTLSNLKLNKNIKDSIQISKSLKTISLVDNIFDKLGELNNIENYNNIKPYTLKISSNKIDDYYKYDFKINRGSINESTFLDFSISINNKEIIYDKLLEIINKSINKKTFLYKSLNQLNDKYTYNINLSKMLKIELITNDIEDKIFFNDILNFDKYISNKDMSVKKLSLTNDN